jgi:hypothetical protein
MIKIDVDDFVGIDHGDKKIDLLEISKGKIPIEMRPVQLHHKSNGAKSDSGDKPSFTIVMAPAGGTLVYGQVSLAMMEKAFDQVGYTLVRKEKTVATKPEHEEKSSN